jgi:hypothetical protein
MPELINKETNYQLANGWEYEMFHIDSDPDLEGNRYVWGRAYKPGSGWNCTVHKLDGHYNWDRPEYTLVPKIPFNPFQDLPIDTPVLATIGGSVHRRHFAGAKLVDNVWVAYVFPDGLSKWTHMENSRSLVTPSIIQVLLEETNDKL